MSPRARWWMLHGGGQCLVLLVPVWLMWRDYGLFPGLVGLGLVLNVAVASTGHAVQYRLGYWRGRIDRGMEFAAAEGIAPPRGRAARAEPWAGDITPEPWEDQP